MMANRYGNEQGNTLVGTSLADKLFGRAGDDILIGDAGDDRLYGGTGFDLMEGGAGDDAYFVDSSGDVVNELSSGADAGGIDTVVSTISYTLGAWLENLSLRGSGPLDGTGNDLVNHLTGAAGINILSGLDGDDTLRGGRGDDDLFGGNGDDTLFGGYDADLLDGGTGADVMTGGAGNDTYYVDHAGDVASELVNGRNSGGIDHVYASLTYTLGAWLNHLTLTGLGAMDGTGNGRANTIVGNDSANMLSGLTGADHLSGGDGDDALDGGAGHDTLNGGSGIDKMSGGGGDDSYIVDHRDDEVWERVGAFDQGGTDSVSSSVSFGLDSFVEHLTLTGSEALGGYGNELNNRITGNSGGNSLLGEAGDDVLLGEGGDDFLNGGAGADEMHGGAGDDWYDVDDIGDVTLEASAEGGLDTVWATATHTLGAFIEGLWLKGSDAINKTGNSIANYLEGNSANNVLDGKGGADVMNGREGDDRYIVDHADDYVDESFSGGGVDLVESSVSFSLYFMQEIENLILVGTGADLEGWGNVLDNQITGNAGDNVLYGAEGDDLLSGGITFMATRGPTSTSWQPRSKATKTTSGASRLTTRSACSAWTMASRRVRWTRAASWPARAPPVRTASASSFSTPPPAHCPGTPTGAAAKRPSKSPRSITFRGSTIPTSSSCNPKLSWAKPRDQLDIPAAMQSTRRGRSCGHGDIEGVRGGAARIWDGVGARAAGNLAATGSG
jgi:Ca2+-binding RTX toxin-like protein